MKSYSETDVFEPTHLALLERATQMVAAVPDDPALRCHELARAVGHVLGLAVQDGYYGLVEHSWLWVKNRDGVIDAILDVYSVGRLPQVQLISTNLVLPHLPKYRIAETRDDIRWGRIELLIKKWEQNHGETDATTGRE